MTTGTTPIDPSAAPTSPQPPTALPIITTRREPKRWMSGPESGSPTTEPTAIANSTKPSSAAAEVQLVADLRDPRGPAREREAVDDERRVDGADGSLVGDQQSSVNRRSGC